jgi:transposase-like protein
METPSDHIIEIKAAQQASLVCESLLEETLRSGAQRLLTQAIAAEVEDYVQRCAQERNERGRRLVVRNGHLPERTLQTGLGAVRVRAPRVEDRREGQRFTSAILPRYLRKVPSLENLIPTLYLLGVSSSDMQRGLEAILGPGARGLSSSTMLLCQVWPQEFAQWNRRDLSEKEYVYVWADGIYFNVRCEDARPCLLVLVGALADGTKELLAIADGERESKCSWSEVLRDLKRRGLKAPPRLAVGDGALGFWAAIEEQWPQTQGQRCWVHKTVNVLDKLPKKLHGAAKQALHQIYLSDTRTHAEEAFGAFEKTYADKHPKAWQCLEKDRAALLGFYDFPAAHWVHLRTSNGIESSFAMVRHRTRQTKGGGSRNATLGMVYKLARQCESKWRRLNSHHLMSKVIQGTRFADGVEILPQAA